MRVRGTEYYVWPVFAVLSRAIVVVIIPIRCHSNHGNIIYTVCTQRGTGRKLIRQ